jgi:hypothetical protein
MVIEFIYFIAFNNGSIVIFIFFMMGALAPFS